MTFKIEIDHVTDHRRSVERLPQKDEPEFSRLDYSPPEKDEVTSLVDADNLVVVGQGGSINAFRAFYYSLIDQTELNVRVVTTNEPDYLNRISRELDSSKTAVCALSRTGENPEVIEAFSYFVEDGFTPIAVTDTDSSLSRYVDRQMGETYEAESMPERFSGIMNLGLIPLCIAGISVDEIRKGADDMYSKMKPENQYNAALNMASALHSLDDRGYQNIALCFYSTRLYGFSSYVSGLMHQTACKEGKGQTFISANGPELHHDIGNRILEGQSDISPLMIYPEEYERSSSGKGTRSKAYGDIDLSRNRLDEALKHERNAFAAEVDKKDIPFSKVKMNEVTHYSVGQLAAFFQYVAYYSALIRDIEPLTSTGTESILKQAFENRGQTEED